MAVKDLAVKIKGAASSLATTIKGVPSLVKNHWNTPLKKGWSLGLKEMAAYCFGGMGVAGVNVFVSFYTLTAGVYLAAELALSVDHLMWVTVATSIISILRTPFVSWLIDNVQTKRFGKFRPWLLWLPIPCTILMFLLGFLPTFSAGNYWALIISYTLVFAVLQTLLAIYYFAYTSLQQVISPSPTERSVVMSVGSILFSLGPSAVQIVFPFLANLIYSTNGQGPGGSGGSDGINQIGTFQTIVPIMAIVLFAIGFITAFGTKERVVLAKTQKENKQKTGFFEGVQSTFQNKYFWLFNTNKALTNLRLLVTSFQNFVYVYLLRTVWAQSVFSSVLGFAYVPGMALAPIVIKKIGAKKTVIISMAGLVVANFLGALITTLSVPLDVMGYILLVMMFFGFFSVGFTTVTFPYQQAQVYDFQQYKTGERLEGFLGQFGEMFLTVVTLATVMVTPIVYSKFGYVSDTNALYNRETITGIISTMCYIGAGAAVLSMIPEFFWDISNKRHEQIMEVLKVRAAHADGKCDETTAKDLENRIENGELGLFQQMFPEEDVVLTQPDDEAEELEAIAEAEEPSSEPTVVEETSVDTNGEPIAVEETLVNTNSEADDEE